MMAFNDKVLILFLFAFCQPSMGATGKLQLVGADYFDKGQHFIFCAFINADGKMVALDNVDHDHCHSETSVDVDLIVVPATQVNKTSDASVNEPFYLPHASITSVNSVYGVPLPPSLSSDSPEYILKKQLDSMASISKERRLAASIGISGLLIVRVKLADDATVDQYCDETCASNNGWGNNSVKTLYSQSSYGSLNIDESQGAVRTVLLATSTSTYYGCNFDQLGYDALQKLAEDGFSASDFNLITFYMPLGIPDCNFGGVAYVGGVKSWLRSSSPGVMGHEIGHSFGVLHAGTDTNNDDVQDTVYGDHSDTMGSSSSLLTMNAVHRYVLGWIPDDAVGNLVCTGEGCSETYTIRNLQTQPYPADGNNNGVSLLRTNRMGRSGDYFISFRADTDLDANLPSIYQHKVSLHYYASENSEFITTLSSGASYQEVVNGVNMLHVSVGSVSHDSAVVTVSFPSATECTTVDIMMTDSYGDGWNGNKLYFDSDKSVFVTLSDGGSGTAQVCLPDGTYTPYACDGRWRSEVGWSIPAYGATGGANNKCRAKYGSFTITSTPGVPTLTPTSAPSPLPTLFPTPVPSSPCVLVTVGMTDSWGDGWNGNYLHFDSDLSVTLPNGQVGSTTICLQPGSYSPHCCGGGWSGEVGWEIVIGGITVLTGGADLVCNLQGQFHVLPFHTDSPSTLPSQRPTVVPSASTMLPTVHPSIAPTATPTEAPNPPSAPPTAVPTIVPTSIPTLVPTSAPTFAEPTLQPSHTTTGQPTAGPSILPTTQPPTAVPSLTPTGAPTLNECPADLRTVLSNQAEMLFYLDQILLTSGLRQNEMMHPVGFEVDESDFRGELTCTERVLNNQDIIQSQLEWLISDTEPATVSSAGRTSTETDSGSDDVDQNATFSMTMYVFAAIGTVVVVLVVLVTASYISGRFRTADVLDSVPHEGSSNVY